MEEGEGLKRRMEKERVEADSEEGFRERTAEEQRYA
jgi:hypothetical protein